MDKDFIEQYDTEYHETVRTQLELIDEAFETFVISLIM